MLAIATLYRIVAIAPSAGSAAYAVSSSGIVAGTLGVDAFTWNDGRLQRYAPIDFVHIGNGGYAATATGVNRAGIAVGHEGTYMPESMSGLELATAAIFFDGMTTLIDPASYGTFEADGVNDRGEIVGERRFRGFVRDAAGLMHEIEPLSNRPEWNGTRASALDNEGHIVGGTTIDAPSETDLTKYPIHAFLMTFAHGAQHMRDLGAPSGFLDSYATAINEDLTVVGYSGNSSSPKQTQLDGPSHAWVWQRGHLTDLGVLSKRDSSFAYGVNDASVIVGCSGNTAVRWVDKKIQDLNSLIDPSAGWKLRCAYAINRSGWIVGQGTHDGVRNAFLLIPR